MWKNSDRTILIGLDKNQEFMELQYQGNTPCRVSVNHGRENNSNSPKLYNKLNMKMYILIKESVPVSYAVLASAHASLAAYLNS